VAADFDLDGDLDLAFANNVAAPVGSNVRVLPNDGDGVFGLPRVFGVGLLSSGGIVAANFDADAFPDLVVTAGTGISTLLRIPATSADADGNGVPDECVDTDGDGLPDTVDNCPLVFNPGQEDADADGVGDVCDPGDADGDGIADIFDNCPGVFNPLQIDANGNGVGDACDPADTDGDMDGDGDTDFDDIGPFVACFIAGSATPPPCFAADMDDDGDVDLFDFALFAVAF